MSAAAPTAARKAAAPCAETLAASVTVLLVMTVLQRSIGLIRGILFCRWLDPAELGQWDLAFGFLMLAAPVAVLGLTGSYGRYLEHYRQRGQLRTFLRRTGMCVAALTAAAVAGLILFPTWFSQFIFGQSESQHLVVLLAAGLLALIGFNFLYELFGGLRMFRLVAALQFWQSLLFAVGGVALVLLWKPTADSLVMAFGAACAVCVAWSLPRLKETWQSLDDGGKLGHRELWSKIVPFAASVWVTNWLANLFDVVDRWMLVHYSGHTAAEALAEVGNYHAARVLPLPLLAVAALLRSAVLPHLSHDWENGRRQEVSARLNLCVKLWGLTMLSGAAALLAVAPWLFQVAFGGKFEGGLAVLPLTLAYLSWAAIANVAGSYLWCAERAGLGSLALLAGLLANVGLNLALVPWLGLAGAVCATALANALALGLTHAFNDALGVRRDLGVWAISAAPCLLMLGPLPVLVALVLLLHQAVRREWLFTADEKRKLAALIRRASNWMTDKVTR
jgi:PST family polysaccharide transporter